MTLDEFLDRLEGVRPAGSEFRAICPAHEQGNTGDLAVREGENGLVIQCFANCPTEAVLAAMGLHYRDLFPHSRNFGEPETIYQYVDEAGALLFEAVRFPGKDFKQRRLDPDTGDWIWKLDDVRRVLYRLPEVLAAVAAGATIYICEGEKDVEALRALGYAATCNPGGAGKWRDEYSAFLQGANVIIVVDRDEPGRRHAEKVRDSLQGHAAGIWLVQAREGKDAYDHLAAGYPPSEFSVYRERTRKGVLSAVELVKEARERLTMTERDLPGYEPLRLTGGHGGVVFRQGRMYACGGYTGDGKSALALQITRGVCAGGAHVGYFTLEMTTTDVTNRLLEHEGLPLWVLEQPWMIPGSQWEEPFKRATAEIEEWPLDVIYIPDIDGDRITEITEDREFDFVVIDHAHRFGWGDRRQLEVQVKKLTNLALDFNIPVLVLCQLRKFERGKDKVVYPKPTEQDFRETGLFAEEAAMALTIWRQRDDSGLTYVDDVTTLSVHKDRHGRRGREYLLTFNGETQLFLPGSSLLQAQQRIVPQTNDPEAVAAASWVPS